MVFVSFTEDYITMSLRDVTDASVLGGAIHAHDVSRIESCRTSRAFLTGLYFGGLACGDDNPFHGVGADRTVNKSLGLEMGHGLLRL
jgi:hypothetical protein